MPVLVFVFAVLAVLNYSIATYALNVVLNVYDCGELADLQLTFNVSIAYLTVVAIVYMIVALIFERIKDIGRFTKIGYYITFALILISVIDLVLTVVHNVYMIRTHSTFELFKSLTLMKRNLNNSNHLTTTLDKLLHISDFFKQH